MMLRHLAIFLTFARACLVRDMTFRANFILECVTSLGWMAMNLAFYLLIFRFTPEIGAGTGWSREPFFAFVATGLIINSIVQALFMPSAEELTEMVRTGGLDAVLVQPLDAQFLLSLHRVDFSSFANGLVGLGLLGWSLSRMEHTPPAVAWVLYPLLVLCGVVILYALVIMLAAATILKDSPANGTSARGSPSDERLVSRVFRVFGSRPQKALSRMAGYPHPEWRVSRLGADRLPSHRPGLWCLASDAGQRL